MLRIRQAVAEDAGRLTLVAQATFLETFAGLLDGGGIVAHCEGELGLSAYQRWLADDHACLWLAETEDGAAPVGYALIAKPLLPIAVGEADLELKRIYLLSRFHGDGGGQALMAAATDEAIRRGASRLLLGVYIGNARAIAFYGRHGFAQVGERQFQVGDGCYRDLVLARDLGSGR